MLVMRPFFILCLYCVFPISIQAQIVVKSISKSRNRVVVSGIGDLVKGETLSHSDEFEEVCPATVVSLLKEKKEPLAILDISLCSNKVSIEKGSVFQRDKDDLLKEGGKAGRPVSPAPSEDGKNPTINESWYALWSFGGSDISYNPTGTNDVLEQVEEDPGVSRGEINFDFFGFYWPLKEKKVIRGFVINVISDSFKSNGSEVTLRHNLYSYSVLGFTGDNIGDKWFWRVDIGLNKSSLDISGGETPIEASSRNFELGYLLGGGYAYPLGPGTRLLTGIYYTHRRINRNRGTSIRAVNVNVGFLF